MIDWLFDDASMFQQAINEHQPADNPLRSAVAIRLEDPRKGELRRLLLDDMSSVRAAAKTLWELPKPRIQKRLLELGLPNLDAKAEQAESLRAGMQAFYVDGNSYAESLKISGMTSHRFDALIRVSGPNFCRALRKMDQKNNRCSRKELAHSLQKLLAVEQVEAMSSEIYEEHQV